MPPPDTFSFPPSVLTRFGAQFEQVCQVGGVVPSNKWTTSDFFALWAAAEKGFDDPGAGLRFGAEGIAQGYSVASIVALHAPDLRHALAALSRYKRLTCPERVEIEIENGEAIVRYRWLQATGTVPRLLVDLTFASLNQLARQGTGGRVVPVRVELARRPTDRALLRQHFGCPTKFGAPHDAMVFESGALDVPFVTADGGAFARVLDGLEERLARGDGFPALAGELRVAIARHLSEGHRPTVAAVARRLRLSTRTLQRRLDECQTSFQHQLAAVRRTTASRLLVDTDLDPVAIAMLLGFAEPNSFARAFRAWEKTTPLRWRERQTALHA